ncbi:hypothetical protein BH20VER2_BH20VER2_18150 [soil metagenome]
MKLASVVAILRALNEAGARALVVGGLAVNAHGFLRFTKDADIAIQLVPDNIERTFGALAKIGYYPRVPITPAQFADPKMRERWIREKEMKVLQFASDAHRETPLDVFVIEPFNFDEEYARAYSSAVKAPGMEPTLARYVTVTTLIQMKEAVARPQDLEDVRHLRWIEEERSK